MRPLHHHHLLFLLLLLLTTLVLAMNKTYYDILNLKQDASLTDIKKAYRTLSLQHHPDRNKGNEEEATIKFRQINEAYEVLSDEDSRREYDRTLRHSGGAGGGARYFGQSRSGGGSGRRRKPRDAFAQFNDVFQNDPFFRDAFKEMDDLFSKTFQENGSQGGSNGSGGGGGGGWGAWFADKLGVNFDIQTSRTDSSGRRVTNSYSRQSGGGGRQRQRSSSGHSTYTSRSTSTIIENGRRITVQSLEKDGNRIEEKYDGTRLVERKINGQRVNLIDDF